MKTLVGIVLVGFSLVAESAHASVTPAHLAMEQVKSFLDTQVERQLQEVLPQHKAANHLIGFQSNLMRGKFSEGDGHTSHYFGNTQVIVQIGVTETYHEVDCSVSATAVVVGFAKQMVPVLEEEVNNEQLVLKRHNVRCTVR